MRKNFILFLCILLSILLIATAVPIRAAAQASDHGTAFLSEYVQTLYDEDSVIPVSQVKSVLQADNGYMWFAGYQGLMRYNGTNTKVFTADDGFPSYNVNVLYEDSQNRIWIGTNDNGIVSYDGNTFTIYGISEGLPAASVRGITEDESGNIYVSTANGIAAISPDGTLTLHPVLDNIFATHIEYIGDGRFVCLLSSGKIVLFNQTNLLKEYESSYFGSAQPRSLFLARNGELYIGTVENMAYIIDSNFLQYRTLTIPDRQTLNSFYEDSNGRIWISTDNGIGYLVGETFTPVEGLLMSNSIECVYEDYEGSFWIGSSRQGLLQLTHGKFTNIKFMAGLPDYTVNTTAVWNGDLYIGADEGLVILQNDKPIQNELTEMLRGIRIRCMLTDSKGCLWICTYEHYGVLLAKPDGSVVSINEKNGLASNMTRCIVEAKNGDMLVGMSGGVSVIRNEEVVNSYTKEDGLINDVILSLAEGNNGILYAGSDGGGIYAIDGDAVKNYTEKDGLAAGVILRMAVISDSLWVSTGNAISYLDDTGMHLLDKLAAYDDNVFDIKQIGDDIWFLHSKGINICNIQNLLSDDELTMTQMLKRDGLSAPITANSWNALSEDGIMYISTGKGVLSVNTLHTYRSKSIPIASISEILADGKPVDMNDTISIPNHVQRIDIHIALLSFISKDGTISYMLEGFDSEPITVSRTEFSLISYTNLKAGKYTFYLYGTNASGVQSETIMLTIHKGFRFTEMPFVRVMSTFLVIGLLSLCIRAFILHRTKTILQQRQEYKEITEQIMSIAAAMSDSRTEYTLGHSHRVAQYSKIVGKRLGMSEEELETLYYAAILHDIGKVGISDSILKNKEVFTDDEFAVLKTHVSIGSELLGKITVLENVALGAKYHHERIDGSGYPDGLSGNDIPLIAKIISACNAFDNMLSEQPHRKAMPIESVQTKLVQGAGTQFDEKITAILISLINEGSVPL